MAAPAQGLVHKLLQRAHSPDTARQIYADKIQHREQFLQPTAPDPLDKAAAGAGAGAVLLSDAAAAGATGLDGRDARRRARRIKQEQRQHRARKLRPRPLSARQRRALRLYEVPTRKPARRQAAHEAGLPAGPPAGPPAACQYATFVPLHRLWLGYVREVLGPELRSPSSSSSSASSATASASAAAKLAAADFHGARVEVTRSACVGRVGLRGIVVRDTRFVFEIVTPDNQVKMVPKEGTFFRVAIPVEGEAEATSSSPDGTTPTLVAEIMGSQFMHRAADRASRKFKQHFYKEL